LIEKQFNPDLLYNRVVHYYIDKKKYSKDKANAIAQTVVKREQERKLCKNANCRHSLDDHIRNSDTGLSATRTVAKHGFTPCNFSSSTAFLTRSFTDLAIIFPSIFVPVNMIEGNC